MYYALFTLIKKELQALFGNSTSLRILIMPVILQVLLFPFAATLEVKNSTLAIYNQDGGAAAQELIQRLSAAKAFPQQIMLYSEAQLKKVIDTQQALLTIRFPADFSSKLARGEAVNLQAIIDGRRSNSAQIAFGYAQQIVQQFARERSSQIPPAQLLVSHLYNPNLDYRWFILPSLIVMITTMGCLMVTALSLAREREEGTYDQLLVSPLTPAYIMIGKAIPGIFIALLQGSIILATSLWIYQVPLAGSVWLLYFTLFCHGLALSGIGLFISALSNSQQQAFLGVFGFMAPAIILSGYVAPIENMPWLLQKLNLLNPLSHTLLAIKSIYLKGFSLADAWPQLLALLLIASVTLGLAYRLFLQRSGQ